MTARPDLAELRALVRNQLPAERAREVRKWLVCSPDPDVPDVLLWLAVEAREEASDEGLSHAARQLGRKFLDALREGAAAIVPLQDVQPPGLAMLGDGRARRSMGVEVSARSGRQIKVRFATRTDERAAVLIATTDAGELFELDRNSAGGHALCATWDCDPKEGRITFWGISSRTVSNLPSADVDAVLALVARAEADATLRIASLRIAAELG